MAINLTKPAQPAPWSTRPMTPFEVAAFHWYHSFPQDVFTVTDDPGIESLVEVLVEHRICHAR